MPILSFDSFARGVVRRWALWCGTMAAGLLPGWASGQAAPAKAPTTYTHQVAALPGKRASFDYAVPSSFQYVAAAKKKPVTLPLPAGRGLSDLLALARANKSLKAEDMLFIQHALAAWDSASALMGFTTTASGLEYKIVRPGTGKLPEPGKRVTVHYRGTLENGRQFDSSYDREQPIVFTLGVRQVIAGWEEGIALLPVGCRGRLRVPPALGYGARALPNIPANSTLIFDIEVVAAD